MWEQIRSNQRRSWILIVALGTILVALGVTLGLLFEPPGSENYTGIGALIGAGVAFGIWAILWIAAISGGDTILLASAGAREIKKEDAPQLWNVVEEMTIASGLGKMPRVFIIDDEALNAFAVGRKQETAAVAVTAGLLRRLNRDELQGVIAHEIGHIKNLDVKFMTMAGVMVGAIVILADLMLRSMIFGAGRRRSSSRDGGKGQALILIVALVAAILAPILAQILYFSASRKREYLADASAARFTRYPPGFANALQKISRRPAVESKANRALAPMYIVSPLQGGMQAVGIFSTHPPTKKRIEILRNMGGAGFAAYEQAFESIEGKDKQVIGRRSLSEDAGDVAIREPTPEPDKKQQRINQAREASDFIDRMADYLVLACACGARIKIPESYKKDQLRCPRCGRTHAVPSAEELAATMTAMHAAGQAMKQSGGGITPGVPFPLPGADKQREKSAEQQPVEARPAGPLTYHRRNPGQWESFRCARCGHTLQLSPKFSAPAIDCNRCGAEIRITN